MVQARAEEGRLLLGAIGDRATVVALDEHGHHDLGSARGVEHDPIESFCRAGDADQVTYLSGLHNVRAYRAHATRFWRHTRRRRISGPLR